MSGNDFNRIIPGYPRDEFTAENYVELQQRVVKMERILAQKVDQWNAPSLLKGYQDGLGIQSGSVSVNPNDSGVWDGTFANVVFTFPEAFVTIPNMVFMWEQYNIPATPLFQKYVATTTGATLSVRFSSLPGAGLSNMVWIAIGEQ